MMLCSQSLVAYFDNLQDWLAFFITVGGRWLVSITIDRDWKYCLSFLGEVTADKSIFKCWITCLVIHYVFARVEDLFLFSSTFLDEDFSSCKGRGRDKMIQSVSLVGFYQYWWLLDMPWVDWMHPLNLNLKHQF